MNQSFRVRLWVTSITAVAFVQAGLASEKPVELGLRKQLLVDDYVIAGTENVTRRLGTTGKANGGKPLGFTRVAEDGRKVAVDVWPLFATVYYDPDRKRFRMWHRVSFNDRSGAKAKASRLKRLVLGRITTAATANRAMDFTSNLSRC